MNNFSCGGVAHALVSNDVGALRDILDPMMASFDINSADGQVQERLLSVVDFLDECPSLEATFSCFECIHSLPPQSEIEVQVITGTTSVTKIIDIARDNSGKFKVVAIHD